MVAFSYGGNMKKIIAFFLGLCLFMSCPISVQAKSCMDVLKSGDFSALSEQDKEDTITALVGQISKDLGLQSTPNLYFYDCAEWGAAAEYYDCINYIYVNMSTFADHADADAFGESIGYHVVKIIAHEMRHDFQFEHMNDDSDFGRAVKANKENYQSYYNNLDGYINQFTEVDADAYAKDYADRYFRRGKK